MRALSETSAAQWHTQTQSEVNSAMCLDVYSPKHLEVVSFST